MPNGLLIQQGMGPARQSDLKTKSRIRRSLQYFDDKFLRYFKACTLFALNWRHQVMNFIWAH